MLLTTALKDYLDQVNYLPSMSDPDSLQKILFQSSFVYFFNSIKLFFIYLFSFHWLTDFVELPCAFKPNYIAILEGKNVLQNILEANVGPNVFSFASSKSITPNHFSTGLLNSFFLCLPLSVVHLLTIRAFLLNGLPAAIYAAAGTILGQFCFLACILFGFESIVLPFFSMEPFSYIVGLIAIVYLLYNMMHNPMTYSVLNKTQKKQLVQLLGINFLFAWTELSSVFQYFGNLTVHNGPTLLPMYETPLSAFSYLSGILLGSIVWTILFGKGIISLRNFVQDIFSIPFIQLNKYINNTTVFIAFTFCLTSTPYYAFDYIMANPLGFYGQDKALQWAKPSPQLQIKNDLIADKSKIYPPFFFNPSPFDRTIELKEEPFVHEDFSFEPTNYWNHRDYIRATSILKSGKNALKNETSAKNDEQTEAFLKQFYLFTPPEPMVNPKTGYIDKEHTRGVREINVDNLAQFMFPANAYSYFEKNLTVSPVTQDKFRKKFYANPIYKALTKFEINGFLLGQPKYQNLTAVDEAKLFNRRLLFNNYLMSIETYKNVIYDNKQPFAEKVYNQQFKGNFDVVRQFFPIEISPPAKSDLKTQNRVIKYDQPLYNEVIRDINPLLHEELGTEQTIPLSKKQLSIVDNAPFYIGWDGNLRKFLVKTNCTPGFPNGLSVDKSKLQDQSKQALANSSDTLLFSYQCWPNTFDSSDPGLNTVTPSMSLTREQGNQLSEIIPLQSASLPGDKYTDEKRLTDKSFNNFVLPAYPWNTIPLKSQSQLSNMDGMVKDLMPPQFGGVVWPGLQVSTELNKTKSVQN